MSRFKQNIAGKVQNISGYTDEDFDGTSGGDVEMADAICEVAPAPEKDAFDEAVEDMDFSLFTRQKFKHSVKRINHTLNSKSANKKANRASAKNVRTAKHIVDEPLTQFIPVEHKATITGGRPINKVIVSRDRDLIIEGVDKYILAPNADAASYKKIGYYKGKKLKELLIQITNNSAMDFTCELFNPSELLDYVFNASADLNARIIIGGGGSDISYSDVIWNMLANPTFIANARISCSGATTALQQKQLGQPLFFKNKNIAATEKIQPMQLQLHKDLFQVANEVVCFDIIEKLNRPFIPDGMDIVRYTVIAGASVQFCFYYKQKSLKKFFFKEARECKKLI